jgi:flagellar hook-associated protein 1 FlgK
MLSTFSGIEIGKRGVIAHTHGLITVGHNLNNAGVEGYSRQRIEFKASDPIYLPGLNREETPGHIGQGMEVYRIERIRDMLLEGEIVEETGNQGYWESLDKYLQMVGQVYNEPTEHSIRFLMDSFFSAWQELSENPTQMGKRQAVLKQSQMLIDGIHHTYQRLRNIRDMLEQEVVGTVQQVNTLTKDIAALNEQIQKAEALGDNPNDLKDKRDMLIEQLAKLIDITVNYNQDPDELIIYTNGRHLVQGKQYLQFDTVKTEANEGYSLVIWQDTGEVEQFRGGKLAALLDLRDVEVRSEIQKLDLMTMNFIDLVNAVHRKGYGLNEKTDIEFFREYPYVLNANGNYDRNGDGAFDSSYIFRMAGRHMLDPQALIGIRGTITLSGSTGDITVEYYPTDTVAEVIARINLSGAEVSARLDEEGKLSLKGMPTVDFNNPDFVIRHVEDSGEFLVGYAGLLNASGAGGAYDWQQVDAVEALRADGATFAVAPLAHPSGWIEVNQELVNEPASIAAASGINGRSEGPEDGSVALTIADLRYKQVMIGDTLTLDDYFAELVASIGLRGQEASRVHQTENLIMKNHKDLRESISGVNIDEELATMIKFQHGYAAAARFITEFDKMLEIIINRMGV